MIGNQDTPAQNPHPNNQLAVWQPSQTTVQVHYTSLNHFCKIAEELIYVGQISQEIINQVSSRNFIPEELQFMAEALLSHNKVHQFVGVVSIRKIISTDTVSVGPIVQQIIDMNLVTPLIELLTDATTPSLQYQAAWALTNITSGSHQHAQVVCQNGAVNLFTQLLQSPHKEVQEQVLWALGNLAGDSAELRDMVLETDPIQLITQLMEYAIQTNATSLLKNGAWVLSNLVRTQPVPPFQHFQAALPVIFKAIQLVPDQEIMTECLWGLSYLSDAPGVNISLFFQPQFMHALINGMKQLTIAIIVPALRTVGHMCFASDSQVFQMMQAGVLQQVGALLQHHHKSVRREASWVISNFTASGPNILSSIIELGVLEKIIIILQVDELEVKKEAFWALANFNGKAELDQMLYQLEKGALPVFISGLKAQYPRIIQICEESILLLLKKTKNTQHETSLKQNIEELGGLEVLEGLQLHPQQQIYKLVSRMSQSQALQCLEFFQPEDEVAEIEEGVKNLHLQ